MYDVRFLISSFNNHLVPLLPHQLRLKPIGTELNFIAGQ